MYFTHFYKCLAQPHAGFPFRLVQKPFNFPVQLCTGPPFNFPIQPCTGSPFTPFSLTVQPSTIQHLRAKLTLTLGKSTLPHATILTTFSRTFVNDLDSAFRFCKWYNGHILSGKLYYISWQYMYMQIKHVQIKFYTNRTKAFIFANVLCLSFLASSHIFFLHCSFCHFYPYFQIKWAIVTTIMMHRI